MKRLIAAVAVTVAALTLSASPASAAFDRHHLVATSARHACITWPADGRFHPAVCRISKVVFR